MALVEQPPSASSPWQKANLEKALGPLGGTVRIHTETGNREERTIRARKTRASRRGEKAKAPNHAG